MATLYRIRHEFRELERMLYESGGEVTQEISARLAELDLAGREKIDAYGDYIQECMAGVKACRDESRRLTNRARMLECRVRLLKQRAREYMNERDVRRIEGKRHTVMIQKHGGKLPIEVDDNIEPRNLPTDYQLIDINITAVRRALEAGEQLDWARLGERGEGVRVK